MITLRYRKDTKILFVLLLVPILGFAGKPNLPWEAVKRPQYGGNMYRMPVPHGWVLYDNSGGMTSPIMVFIPDENHEWALESNS